MERKATEGADPVRISIRLSPPAREAVEEIMQLGGMSTIQDAIRTAISDELFLLRQRREGWTVMLTKDGKEREVQWPGLM